VSSQTNQPDFLSNLLDWTVIRRDRAFQVYVVEPNEYDPQNHSRIFEAALSVFFQRQTPLVDPYTETSAALPNVQNFDLITFPEAFLPADGLLQVLDSVRRLDDFGCVHVGLRPSGTNPNHLFLTSELRTLLDQLKLVPGTVPEDFSAFSGWLMAQTENLRFNIGCLFTMDAEHKLRVCLHPKLVQSKYEVSPLPEDNMEEANLLTIVTLRPTEKKYKTVSIQPLICSDALNLPTKRNNSRPLEALQRDADSLGRNPPDHIDIVSVPTCSPQEQNQTPHGTNQRMWHRQFRNTFERAASDDALARHHFATFVLSNFQTMPAGEPGGLSGAFIPVPALKKFPSFVSLSCWGHPHGASGYNWSTSVDDCFGKPPWCTSGYIASLNPFGQKANVVARIFGFVVARLPRDQSLWSANPGLTHCQVKTGDDQGQPPSLVFA
jgi:hypothetical protein